MLAAGAPDTMLTQHLAEAFPLVGVLPAAGNLEAVTPSLELEPQRLQAVAPSRNAELLQRARRGAAADPEVREAFVAKAAEEARHGRCRKVRPGGRAARRSTPEKLHGRTSTTSLGER